MENKQYFYGYAANSRAYRFIYAMVTDRRTRQFLQLEEDLVRGSSEVSVVYKKDECLPFDFGDLFKVTFDECPWLPQNNVLTLAWLAYAVYTRDADLIWRDVKGNVRSTDPKLENTILDAYVRSGESTAMDADYEMLFQTHQVLKPLYRVYGLNSVYLVWKNLETRKSFFKLDMGFGTDYDPRANEFVVGNFMATLLKISPVEYMMMKEMKYGVSVK